jgi:CTP synthase (UTP-ammonia lyase)
MAGTVRVGIVGDYDPGRVSHPATVGALEHASRTSGVAVEAEWLATASLERRAAEQLDSFGAVFCAPGDYQSSTGALEAIRTARESGTPFLGTCNGFQHAVIEFARNVLGIAGAAHAETSPDSPNLFIRPLSCSLVGKKMRVSVEPGSLAYAAYGRTEAEEVYRCDFGLDPARHELLREGGLHVSGTDAGGEARILELPEHPFFVATLFVPQLSSSVEESHPLVTAFFEAALEGVAGRASTGSTKAPSAPSSTGV